MFTPEDRLSSNGIKVGGGVFTGPVSFELYFPLGPP
jgi:hypothetical protein